MNGMNGKDGVNSLRVHDPYERHLYDTDPMLNIYNCNLVNLSVGTPGPDLLKKCSSLLKKATQHRLEEEEKEGKYYLFQYGIKAGMWEFRDELSKFLTRRYGDPVSRENLLLTCGATYGLQMILDSVIAPNGVVFVDEVTYIGALGIFKQFCLLRVVPVPMKDDVVDLDVFQKLIEEEKKKRNYKLCDEKIFWAIYYTVTIFHNPTGVTFSSKKSRRLVKMAREHSFAVVSDDVYNLLHYHGENPPHRLITYDNPKDCNYNGGNVISNGSFSKILSPGLRIGWIECGPKIINILKESGVLKSGGAANHYVSGVVTSLLELRLQDEHLDYLIKIYKERMEVLCDVLDKKLPSFCSFRHPEGGVFVWLRFPEDFDTMPFMKWCQEAHKVLGIPGSLFSIRGRMKNYVRISIAFHTADSIGKAANALCTAITEYAQLKADENALRETSNLEISM